ncbi:MAG: cyclic nucleotide-binding domain-containing protein [Polyangiaceae bacterium]
MEVPIRREKFFQTHQRVDGNGGLRLQMQRRALHSVEHPRGDAKTIASVVLGKMTAEYCLADTSKLTANDDFSPEQWMPAILHAATTDVLGSVSPASGEMSLLTGEARSASIVALESVECYRVDKEDVQQVLSLRPDVAEQLADVLTRRQAELAEARENLDSSAKASRVSRVDILGKIRSFFRIGDGQGPS